MFPASNKLAANENLFCRNDFIFFGVVFFGLFSVSVFFYFGSEKFVPLITNFSKKAAGRDKT